MALAVPAPEQENDVRPDKQAWTAPCLKRVALGDAELGPGILDDADFSLT